MKKLYLILLLLTVTLSGLSQTVGDAFYIYRNDGEFNAFFRDEVQSIEYSYEDADGNIYDEIMTQIVTTADSIYKIPLASIDSVSFVQQEMILQPNVTMMDQGIINYLCKVNGMTLSFSSSMPQSLLPPKGQILVSTDREHPLFKQIYIGEVESINNEGEYIIVKCDSVGDITKIFKKLVGIERFGSIDSHSGTKNAASRSQWVSTDNILEIDLGLTKKVGSDGEVSLSGFFKDEYVLTVTYIIEDGTKIFKFDVLNKTNLGARLNVAVNDDFGFIGPVIQSPAFWIPVNFPAMYIQFAVAPFFKGEGNVGIDYSFNSPTNTYLWTLINNNKEWKFYHKKISNPDVSEDHVNSELSLSFNGYLHTGGMIDVTISTIPIMNSYLMAYADFYVGPKLVGDFSIGTNFSDPANIYTEFKDSHIDAGLSIDMEISGEGALSGFKTPKALFFKSSMDLPITHKWYLFPEFSNLKVKQEEKGLSASLFTTPSRDILFPLRLGIGLFHESGELITAQMDEEDYKRENEDFLVYHSFHDLKPNVKYLARPMIKIFGKAVPALPETSFEINMPDNMPVITDFSITNSSYSKSSYTYNNNSYDFCFDASISIEISNEDNVEDWGYVYQGLNGDTAHVSLKGYTSPYTDTRYSYYRNTPISYATIFSYVKYNDDNSYYHSDEVVYPLIYDKQPEATTMEVVEASETSAKVKCGYKEAAPWGGVCGVEYWKDADHQEVFFETASEEIEVSLNNLTPNTTYYYRAFIKVGDEYYRAEVTNSFTTQISLTNLCPDDHHPHMIDLGLPSGTKWACCNIGANSPEIFGSYFAWGETTPNTNFTWNTYQYGRSAEDVDYIGSDIAATNYDAAFVLWGNDYQTPSMELCKELIESTKSTWVTINGVQGRIFTGTNGASIFLPASGCRIREEIRYVGESGHYWTSTYHDTEPRLARNMTISTSGAGYQGGGGRFNGHPIRPVQPSK